MQTDFPHTAKYDKSPAVVETIAVKTPDLYAIGAQCGNKDHATVLHACRTVSNLAETDKRFRVFVDDLKKKLTLVG